MLKLLFAQLIIALVNLLQRPLKKQEGVNAYHYAEKRNDGKYRWVVKDKTTKKTYTTYCNFGSPAQVAYYIKGL